MKWWEHWSVRLLIAAFPLVFALGATYRSLDAISDQMADVVVDVHESETAAATREARVDALERQMNTVEAEIRRNGENISAICQATGALCR